MNSARPSTFGWSASGRRSPTSSRAPEVSRFVAGTQLESCTRRSIAVRHRAVEEIAQARLPQHVGDLVRIADRRRHAVAQHASVEFERRDERAFDMAMRVDEARNDDLAADVDLPDAAIVAERPDDPVGADRNIARNEVAADEIEDSPALQHDVRLREPLALLDGAGEKGDGVAHEPVPLGLQRRRGQPYCFRLARPAQASCHASAS